MQEFEYCRPANLSEALALLRDGVDSKLIAGGQSLLGAMKLGLMAPARLIDLAAIAELKQERTQANERCFGAMQTHAELAQHSGLRAEIPGLARLASHIADEQVRSMGTLGGSLANADPSACWPAAMLALGATLRTDRRNIEVIDYFTGLFGTALEADEILCAVQIKRPRRMAYLKIEQMASRFALVGVAIAQLDDGTVRVALTGSAQGALRLPAFEQALSKQLSHAALQGLKVDEGLMSSDVHAEADYRAHLATVLVGRVLTQILLEKEA